MRKIKFRGRAIEDYRGNPIKEEKYVYGNIWTNEDNSYVIIGEYKDKDGCCYNYRVDPESVRQYIGVDSMGNELYEDDMIINSKGLFWQPDIMVDCGEDSLYYIDFEESTVRKCP